MSGDFGLVYPLWTHPQGRAGLLDRAAGEVGLDHLTVPAVTGNVEQFRIGPACPPHTFHTEGGWHYPPRSECYGSGSVRPRAARWPAKRNVLAQVCDWARQRDVPVIVRIELRGVGALLEHAPHLRARNAWGDEVVTAGACVLNPELRELLRATLEDLRSYEPAGFQLVDWTLDLPTDRRQRRPLDWHPLARRLLDVCFCPACRQTAALAGIDPDQAARSVCVHVERLLAHTRDEELTAGVEADEVLDAYVQARRRDAATWLQRLAEMYAGRRYLLSEPDAYSAAGALLPADVFVLVLPVSGWPWSDDEEALRAALRPLSAARGLALPVWRPAVEQADRLVRVVSAAAKAGIEFFDFEGLDEAPAEAVTWLKQAVRFARRG